MHALEAKAAKAGLEKTADTRLADLVRAAFAACHGLLHELDIAYAEQARLEKRVAAQETAWTALFDRLPCACVCTDVNGFILKANDAAASLLAISSRHLDARMLTYFAEDREQFSRALRRAAWDRVEVHERMSIRPRDRAPVLVEAVVMTKTPDDNNTLLWFLQPVLQPRPLAKATRRPNDARAAAAESDLSA